MVVLVGAALGALLLPLGAWWWSKKTQPTIRVAVKEDKMLPKDVKELASKPGGCKEAFSPNPSADPEWARYAPLGPSDTAFFPWPGFVYWSEADCAKFKAICAKLQIPINSAAFVLRSESGLIPKTLTKHKVFNKDGSLKGELFSGGLCQLTVGANVPGYTKNADIERFAGLPISEQLDVIAGFWAKLPLRPSLSPGRMYMANFLPACMWWEQGKILGEAEGKAKLPGGLTTGAVYAQNPGFDPGKKRGLFTVGDVLDYVGKTIQRDASALEKRT